ncbi:Similar to Polyamine transporter 4; acc. no. Q12256 [Pyronema omphalodes CBS 100304]|uniref:Similar to Polyamine transporter 4 acc. no. Q12256 n=1 Tax=Pyronema omphalodes (strain CBS 100304) TaxID=1076935 RepID=U4LBK5_PYROM|nr:Similar to Polyamine transporter 4; acc. no. Q12256 [Pyronema omphalodes CBS 100304]
MANLTQPTTESPFFDPSSLELQGPEDPRNWSKGRKWLLSLKLCIFCFAVSMGSTIFTPAVQVIARQFHESDTVAILGISMYVIGFAVGPVFFSPLSEVYGRKVVLIPVWLLFCALQFGCIFAPNMPTLLVFRLLVGIAGSPSLTVAGGLNADFWKANEIGPPLGLFTMSAFLGPVCGPIVGGFLIQEIPGEEGWRWCFRIQLILSVVLCLNWLYFPETYRPLLLERKLRAQNIDLNYLEMHDDPRVGLNKGEMFKRAIFRPLQMLFGDPIVFFASLYAYPIVFRGRYHMKSGVAGLAFLGIGLGVIMSFLSAGYANRVYLRLKKERGLENSTFPEGKLPPAMVAAFFIPVSLFMFGWTGAQGIHWMVPIVSGVPFGWGFCTIFINLVSYVAEGYLYYASSALAANTILRSLFAASFPLFSMKLYSGLKSEWASSLLGFISVAFIPVPYLFWKYGPTLRQMSKFHCTPPVFNQPRPHILQPKTPAPPTMMEPAHLKNSNEKTEGVTKVPSITGSSGKDSGVDSSYGKDKDEKGPEPSNGVVGVEDGKIVRIETGDV